MTEPSDSAGPSAAYPSYVVGVAAIVLSAIGVVFVASLGIASLLGIVLGLVSLVRTRRRGGRGGLGLIAVALGFVGLIVLAVVLAPYVGG